MRNLFNSLYLVDVANVQQTGREPSVDIEYFIINQRGDRQKVEQICEFLPDGRASIFPLTPAVEAIDLCNLPGLMVPAK